jgi:hypothetical protein
MNEVGPGSESVVGQTGKTENHRLESDGTVRGIVDKKIVSTNIQARANEAETYTRAKKNQPYFLNCSKNPKVQGMG